MAEFLISVGYRTTGKSAIWKLNTDSLSLKLFREDQYYPVNHILEHNSKNPNVRFKDFIYFGMDIYHGRLYCVGGKVLSVLDMNGNLLQRRDLDFLKDAHALRAINGKIYCANTGHDSLEVFSKGLEHQDSIQLKDISCFQGRKLLKRSEHSSDSLHVNFINFMDRGIFVTHSYTCERDMLRAVMLAAEKIGSVIGRQPSRNRGVVERVYGSDNRSLLGLMLGLVKGKILNSGGVVTIKGKRVLDNLYGAHDGIFYKSRFFINSSHNIETLIYDEGFRLLEVIQYNVGMFVRGLHPIDDNTLLVGASRVNPVRSASSIYYRVLKARGASEFEELSSVKIVDIRTGEIIKSVYFDKFHGVHPDIYTIIPAV